jgi:hypothetical protein
MLAKAELIIISTGFRTGAREGRGVRWWSRVQNYVIRNEWKIK